MKLRGGYASWKLGRIHPCSSISRGNDLSMMNMAYNCGSDIFSAFRWQRASCHLGKEGIQKYTKFKLIFFKTKLHVPVIRHCDLCERSMTESANSLSCGGCPDFQIRVHGVWSAAYASITQIHSPSQLVLISPPTTNYRPHAVSRTPFSLYLVGSSCTMPSVLHCSSHV